MGVNGQLRYDVGGALTVIEDDLLPLLLDTVAATCASDNAAGIERLYATEDFAVPESMLA